MAPEVAFMATRPSTIGLVLSRSPARAAGLNLGKQLWHRQDVSPSLLDAILCLVTLYHKGPESGIDRPKGTHRIIKSWS